jgi:hypothetical protein
VIEGVLVGLVGGLELILHQVAVAERAPEIAVGIVDLEGATEEVDGLNVVKWAEGGEGGRKGEKGGRGGASACEKSEGSDRGNGRGR